RCPWSGFVSWSRPWCPGSTPAGCQGLSKHRDGLDDTDSRGVIRPYAPIDKPHMLPWKLVGGEGRRCSTGGHCHLPHRHLPIPSQSGVMRCFEQVHAVLAQVVGRDHEGHSAFTKFLVTYRPSEHGLQSTWGILRPNELLQCPDPVWA